jgi:hypothetical protein
LIVIPALLQAKDFYVRIPRRFLRRPAARKTIHGKVAERIFAGALDGVENGRRDANNVGGMDGMFLLPGASPQNALTFQNVKNLLGVVVLVQRRRLARRQNDEENLGGGGIGAVHYQVINVGGEAVVSGLRGRKDELHEH